MSQSQLKHLEDNFLYLCSLSLHFCVMRWEWTCVRLSVSVVVALSYVWHLSILWVQQGVMLLHCRSHTHRTRVKCVVSPNSQQCQLLMISSGYIFWFSEKLQQITKRWNLDESLCLFLHFNLSVQWSADVIFLCPVLFPFEYAAGLHFSFCFVWLSHTSIHVEIKPMVNFLFFFFP